MVDDSRLGRLDLRSSTLQRAGTVTGGLFILLASITLTGILSILPAYPAVILAYALWCILPGWFLQRALFANRNTGLVEQVVLAVLMSVALAAVPGVIALRLHWSLEAFAFAYALLAAVVSGASLLWQPRRDLAEGEANEEPSGAASGTTLLLILVAVPLLAIVTSPWWGGDRIARDADDFVYTGYLTTYVNSNELDASAPFSDARPGSFGRMEVNVWLVLEALVAKSADVEGFDLHMHYLPGILTVIAVAAMYALAKGLFGSTRLALLAAALILIHAFLDLAPQEGFGRMLLLRMAQDKMAASFIFVPAGILLSAWYLERPSPSAYAAVLLAAIATFVVHPLGLMSLGIALGGVAALRVLVHRTRESFMSAAYLVGPWLLLGIGVLLWSWLFADRVEIFGPYFRRKFNVTDVPGGMLVGNYHLLLHPMVIAAIVLAVPAWLLAPRKIGNQVLLGVVAGVLLIFYVPFIATPIAEATREEAVWRLHRLIPVALILAVVLHYGMLKLSAISNAGRLRSLASPLSSAAAPAAGVLLVFAAALLIQEQYAVADEGSYYNRTSQTELLPWTGGSIFLGGVDRAFSSDFRPTALEQALLDFLAQEAPPGAVVLATPDVSTRFLESVLNQVRPIDYFGAPQIQERRAARDAFFAGELIGEALEEMLDRFHVDYVVLVSGTISEEAVQAAGGVRPGLVKTIQRIDADGFAHRQGELGRIGPQFEDDKSAYTAWAFGPDERGEVVAHPLFLTIPEGANAGQLVLSMELAPGADVAEGGVARMVVTLERLDATEGAVRQAGEPSLVESLQSIAADEFSVRQGEPRRINTQFERDKAAYTGWAFGPDQREEVVAHTSLLTVPGGADARQLVLSIELAPGAEVVEDAVARIVVTLERLEGAEVVGEPIHVVADVRFEARSEVGTPYLQVRSPSGEFSVGERYRIRIWRDGAHEIDTYPDDVWFAGLDIIWSPKVVGDPIHTVADVYIEGGSEAGVAMLRVRTPAAEFSAGEQYRIRVWRDGAHEFDTYPDDVWFASVDIGWRPQGPPLGSSVYEIYSVPTN